MWTVMGIAFIVFVATVIGMDVRRNPQSYRDLGLFFGDVYWTIYFWLKMWPAAVVKAHRYEPRHASSRLPGDKLMFTAAARQRFMSAWHG
jgi:hypothetical protein